MSGPAGEWVIALRMIRFEHNRDMCVCQISGLMRGVLRNTETALVRQERT